MARIVVSAAGHTLKPKVFGEGGRVASNSLARG